mmetsp:Transcript_89261/g.213194  ORF Transcript_89261/g.213194 Transcript_89261/m.213194 type:complete len:221 (-) Transcript_89261:759-1421(-)
MVIVTGAKVAVAVGAVGTSRVISSASEVGDDTPGWEVGEGSCVGTGISVGEDTRSEERISALDPELKSFCADKLGGTSTCCTVGGSRVGAAVGISSTMMEVGDGICVGTWPGEVSSVLLSNTYPEEWRLEDSTSGGGGTSISWGPSSASSSNISTSSRLGGSLPGSSGRTATATSSLGDSVGASLSKDPDTGGALIGGSLSSWSSMEDTGEVGSGISSRP